jgi:hypothetical protein
MIIYRLAQAEGGEQSKDWVQLTLIMTNDSGGEPKQKVIRLPKLVFLQMATSLEHDGLPYTKVEEKL